VSESESESESERRERFSRDEREHCESSNDENEKFDEDVLFRWLLVAFFRSEIRILTL
jgi:hypothetical protein